MINVLAWCDRLPVADAERVAHGWQQQEGCLDVMVYAVSDSYANVAAYLEAPQNIDPNALCDGCRLVPSGTMEYMVRRGVRDTTGIVRC